MPPKKKTAQTKKRAAAEKSIDQDLRNYDQLLRKQAGAKRWLYLGVASFMIIIGALWGWSLKLQIGAYRYEGSEEQLLIEENKKNWDLAFKAAPTDPIADENPQEKIKETIALIMEGVSSTKNFSTSTVVTTSTK